MLTLSQLIIQARGIDPPLGNLPGDCIFCGQTTEHGHRPRFGDSFTNAPYLSDGSIICPAYTHMGEGKQYRVAMWLVSENSFRFFKRDEARAILTEPPEPTFAICLTRTWKKSSWQALLRLNGGVSQSRDLFPVGFDYDPCYIDRHKLIEDLARIDGLHKPDGKLLLTKRELEAGKVNASGVSKLMAAGLDVIGTINYLRSRANDPAWTVAVYVA